MKMRLADRNTGSQRYIEITEGLNELLIWSESKQLLAYLSIQASPGEPHFYLRFEPADKQSAIDHNGCAIIVEPGKK